MVIERTKLIIETAITKKLMKGLSFLIPLRRPWFFSSTLSSEKFMALDPSEV